jgi:hypothetical protein
MLVVLSLTGSAAAESSGNRWAVTVGLADYQNLQDNSFNAISPPQFGDVLINTCNFNPSRIVMLTDSQATSKNIISSLTSIRSNPSDLVVFYFIGHGVDDSTHAYICPYESHTNTYASDISGLKRIAR